MFNRLGALVATLLLTSAASGVAIAGDDDKSGQGWNGAIGFGPMAIPKYTGGKQMQLLPLPLLSINYDETFYIEIQRAGVYVLASDDKKIGLGIAVEPRLGFHANDGSRLTGMATRRNSLEGGLTFDWDFDFIAFSSAWFTDATRSSRGSSMRFSLYCPTYKTSQGEIGVIATADRMSARTANYFFGVRSNEATLSRPAFMPGAGTTASIGVGGTWRTSAHGALIFGANIGKLPGTVARSPIVETGRSAQIYLGYGWAL